MLVCEILYDTVSLRINSGDRVHYDLVTALQIMVSAAFWNCRCNLYGPRNLDCLWCIRSVQGLSISST